MAKLKIIKMFLNNGYKLVELEKLLEKIENKRLSFDVQPKYIYWRLAYVPHNEQFLQKTVKKINQLLNGFLKLRIAYNTIKSSSFFRNKDKIVNDIKSNLVYEYKCDVCNSCYIGETVRHFVTRRNHKSIFKLN